MCHSARLPRCCTMAAFNRVANIVREECRVRGNLTEVYAIRATPGECKIQLVVIPGNPGNSGYYKGFMRELFNEFRGQADVLAVTHLGHSPEGTAGDKSLWSIQDQIQHKADFLQEHVLLPARPDAVLLAHSIGAYMALHALQMLGQGEGVDGSASVAPGICKVVALFPFLAFDWSQPGQRFLRLAARWYGVMGAVAGLLSALPQQLQSAVIKNYSGDMGSEAVEVTIQSLRREAVANNFFLADTEFRLLDAPLDPGPAAALGPRLALVAAPNDTWMSRQQFETLTAALPEAQVYWEQDLSHSFCVSDQQCAYVAKLVAKALAFTRPDLLPSARDATAAIGDGARNGSGRAGLEKGVQEDAVQAGQMRARL